MINLRFTGLLGLCTVLAACDHAPSRDITAPDPRRVMLDEAPAEITTLARLVDRVDQEGEISTEQLRSTLEAFGYPSILASDGTTECVGTLVGTFETVEVPPGEQCFLINSVVERWVKALDDSQLFIFNTQIGGNLHGLSPRAVQLLDLSTVEGHMHIQDASDPVFVACSVRNAHIVGNHHCLDTNNASAWVHTNSVVDGSLNMKDNFVPPPYTLRVQNSGIGRNAHISHNTGAGLKTVNLNTVGHLLACEGNDPPFIGGPNVAEKYQGECF